MLNCLAARKRLLVVLLVLGPAACSSDDNDGDAASYHTSDSEDSVGVSSESGGDGAAQSGTLTAGSWDDNLNFALYETFLATAREANGSLPMVQPVQRAHAVRENVQALDLAFVIDATGSMGDEMSYVLAEVQSIVDGLHERTPGVTIRLGLVVYRDQGDTYVTRTFQLSPELDAFRDALAGQSADGGGDYPEAYEQGLQAALELDWNEQAVRVIVQIADAPPHSAQLEDAIERADDAAGAGVAIFPVAASGADADLEFVMRYSAQTTGGRYIFVTDDSGIGASHTEPTIPCYVVQRLNALLTDVLVGEVEGTLAAPAAANILRVAGTFDGASCTSADGQITARLY